MNKINKVTETKNKNQYLLNLEVRKRVKELKKTKEFKILEKEILDFEDDPYKEKVDFRFNEYGNFESFIELNLDDFEEEVETIEALLQSITDIGHFEFNKYSKTYEFIQCLGNPTIYNESPKQNHYAIYSQELDLKINKVFNACHGFLLIEQAMRKCGIYENIVSTDYYGQFSEFLSIPEDIAQLSDNDLIDHINLVEIIQDFESLDAIEAILDNFNIELISYSLAPNPNGFCYESSESKIINEKLDQLLNELSEKEEKVLKGMYL